MHGAIWENIYWRSSCLGHSQVVCDVRLSKVPKVTNREQRFQSLVFTHKDFSWLVYFSLFTIVDVERSKLFPT